MLRTINDRNESIQTIVSSIGDAMIACDLEGKIIFYNPAAIELLGPDLSDVTPQNLNNNWGIFNLDKVTLFPIDRYPLLLGLSGQETNDIEHFIRNKAKPDGVFVSITGRPVRGPNSEILGSVVAVKNISNRKKVEEEIRTVNASLFEKNIELLAANKELEAFSYAVSHDLRTPLRAIIGFSDILLRKFPNSLTDEGLDYLHRIKDSGEKLGQLIDGLLDLASLTKGETKKELVNLSLVAQNIADNFQIEDPHRKVIFDIKPNLMAQADKRLMLSVLQNLIGNAWKFTSKKAETKIEFGICSSPSLKTTYFVKDNGAGFNEKYSNKLFNIFQRLHSAKEYEGNGIGLATAERVIHRHGGTIWAEGKPNEGATFYFTL